MTFLNVKIWKCHFFVVSSTNYPEREPFENTFASCRAYANSGIFRQPVGSPIKPVTAITYASIAAISTF